MTAGRGPGATARPALPPDAAACYLSALSSGGPRRDARERRGAPADRPDIRPAQPLTRSGDFPA